MSIKIYNILFCVFLLFSLQKVLNVNLFIADISIIDISTILLFFVLIYLKRIKISKKVIFLLIAVSIFFIFNISLSSFPIISFKSFLSLLLKILFIFVLFSFIERRNEFDSLISIYARSGTLFIFIFAIYQLLTDSIFNISGPFANRNEMLLYLLPLAPLLIANFLRFKTKLDLILFTFLVFLVLLSRGRSGLIILIFSIFLTVFLSIIYLPRFRIKLIAILFSIVVIVTLSIAMISSIDHFTYSTYFNRYVGSGSIINQYQQNYGSLAQRMETLSAGAEMWNDNPYIGVGLGSFKENTLQYSDLSIHDYQQIMPHNTYMGILSECGGIGLLLFLVALIMPINVWKRLNNRDFKNKIGTISLIVSYISILLFSFTYDSLSSYVLWTHLALLLIINNNKAWYQQTI